MHVPKPRKEKEDLSPESKRRKLKCVTNVAENTIGKDGANFYITEEVRRKGKMEREELLVEMGLAGEMSTEEGIAMFVDMGLTWSSMRKFSRYICICI